MALTTWNRLLQSKNLPLEFVGGWRNPVSHGVCCKPHSHQGIEIVHHPSGRGHTRLKNADPVSFAEDSFIVYAPQLIHDQVMEKEGEDLCIQLMAPQTFPAYPAASISKGITASITRTPLYSRPAGFLPVLQSKRF